MRNCYDFDKTIYRKDSSIKFYFYCLKRRPTMIFGMFILAFYFLLNAIGMVTTKRLKERFFGFLNKLKNVDELVEKFWAKEIKNINVWYNEIKREDDVICSASPQFLVEPAIKIINPNALVICTQMDRTTGVITGENLKGVEKVNKLKEVLAEDVKFDSVYTDSMSDLPILDLAENKYIVCGKRYYKFGEQKPTLGVKIKYIIKQMRVKHYVKNGLIFLPLFFSGLLSQWNSILACIFGFISFCLMASFVYVVNDLMDVKNDRKHTTKRKRPIACYMIKKHEAIVMAILLFVSSVLINYFAFGLNPLIYVNLIGYAVVNLLYSLWLKNVPIVDVFMLSACYLLRVFYGGLIIGASVSKWLYLTILCGSLFMGFGKRRNEIKNEKEGTRKVSKHYSYNFLDKNLYICLAMCLIFYSLWTIDFNGITAGTLNRWLLLFTIPIVYFIMMRYSLDIEKTSNNGDPIDVLLKDFILIISAVVFVVMIILSVYLPAIVI